MSPHDAAIPPDRAGQGAPDSYAYFRYMADYIGLTDADVAAIRATRPIIERHLPAIVAAFYTQVLRYPPTRRFFLKKSGEVDDAYLELRMRHLANFWLRTADGQFDEEFARYIDYVGRAHTSRGADPTIYIPERYVIGQVGMIQHAISNAVARELRAGDDEQEFRAVEAWDKLMIVILEMLARAYGHERKKETYAELIPVDEAAIVQLAAKAIRREHGRAPRETMAVTVAKAADIVDGSRAIVDVDGLSIGIFHHNQKWYALRNQCIHRGGPVATGPLDGDVLTCPWHGFRYDVRTGTNLVDPDAELERYEITVREGDVILHIPLPETLPETAVSTSPESAAPPTSPSVLAENEFDPATIPPGQTRLLYVDGEEVALFNVEGTFYATQDACTHTEGPLSESDLEGTIVTCFLHGSCFDVTTGAVHCGPATEPLRTYRVEVEGGKGRVLVRGK